MPRSLSMYLAEPWNAESVSQWMLKHGWTVSGPGSSHQLEMKHGGRAWIVPVDSETVEFCLQLGGFTPTADVLFEPLRFTPGGVRRVMRTVVSLGKRSSALLLVEAGEHVLLRGERDSMHVPAAAREWWEAEEVSDLLLHGNKEGAE